MMMTNPFFGSSYLTQQTRHKLLVGWFGLLEEEEEERNEREAIVIIIKAEESSFFSRHSSTPKLK
jgi:hypothetical protein